MKNVFAPLFLVVKVFTTFISSQKSLIKNTLFFFSYLWSNEIFDFHNFVVIKVFAPFFIQKMYFSPVRARKKTGTEVGEENKLVLLLSQRPRGFHSSPMKTRDQIQPIKTRPPRGCLKTDQSGGRCVSKGPNKTGGLKWRKERGSNRNLLSFDPRYGKNPDSENMFGATLISTANRLLIHQLSVTSDSSSTTIVSNLSSESSTRTWKMANTTDKPAAAEPVVEVI